MCAKTTCSAYFSINIAGPFQFLRQVTNMGKRRTWEAEQLDRVSVP